MRILVCTHCTVLGGANRSMLGLIDNNKNKGIEYYAILPDNGPLCGELEKRNVKYYIFPYYNWVHYGNSNSRIKAHIKLLINSVIAKRISRIIEQENIDIVHTNDSLTMVGALSAQYAGVKHFWHIREFLDDDYNLYYNYSSEYVRMMYESSERVIAISKVIEDHIINKLKLNNCVLVYNGLERIEKSIQKGQEFLVAFSGGDSENKGINDVINAFGIILSKRTDIHLVIGGRFINESLKQRIAALDQHGCVRILSETRNWKEWLDKAHVSLVCSRKEAFGRVTVESMFAKAIVVASDTGANTELIQDGVDGYIYPIGNAQKLSEIICYIKDHYNEQGKIISTAYIKADERFNIATTADCIFQLYREALSQDK